MRKIFQFMYLDHTFTITKQNSATYAIVDWKEDNTQPKEKISWIQICKIQRKGPPRPKTKASEKSLSLKIGQEEHKVILRGTGIHTMWWYPVSDHEKRDHVK